MRILVVEDEFTARTLLLEYARPFGNNDVAASGEEAVLAVKSALERGKPYELILLDIFLPNKAGSHVLREIRQMERESGVKPAVIVIISSLDMKSAKMAALKLSADGYLVKPVEESTFRQELARHGLTARF